MKWEGLAPDGGLFVPEQIPSLTSENLHQLCEMDYRTRAVKIMRLYLEEFSDLELEQFAAAAYGAQFDDPAVAPVKHLNENTSFLELWHGPACAKPCEERPRPVQPEKHPRPARRPLHGYL